MYDEQEYHQEPCTPTHELLEQSLLEQFLQVQYNLRDRLDHCEEQEQDRL